MTVTCELCGSEVGDLANVCTHCARGLRIDLDDIPSLDTELEIAVAKLTRIGSGGGRASEPRLPVNLDADTVGRQLKAVLTSWAGLVADERGIAPPIDGITPTSTWLLRHVEWLRHHPAGADAVVEIRDAVRDTRRIIDRPAPRTFAGYCDCGTPLYARQDATFAACPTCVVADERRVYDVHRTRDAMLTSMADMVMPPVAAAYALSTLVRPIPANTIRVWARRGKLLPADVDDRGHALYRLSDVAKLMMPDRKVS